MRLLRYFYSATLLLGLCTPAHAQELFPLQQVATTNSPDGSIIYGGQAGSLITSEGTWTFGATNGTDWATQLNGTANGEATSMQITNGNLYAFNTGSGHWYVRQSAAWVDFGTTAPVEGGGGSGSFTCGPATGTDAATDVAAAGFNTCAIGNDFTQAIPNTVGTGLPSNWLDCSLGGNTSGSGTVWYWHSQYTPQTPCTGHVAWNVTDPVNGNYALQLTMSDSDVTTYGADVVSGMSTLDYSGDNPTPGPGQFPYGYYEWTYRNDNTSSLTTNSFWSFISSSAQTLATGSASYEVELDFLETGTAEVGHVTDTAGNKWGPGTTKNATFYTSTGLATDLTNYHTWGALFTGDGGSNFSFCSYVDGARVGCVQEPYNVTGENLQRRYLLLWLQVHATGFGTSHQYVKDVKVLSCADWTLGTSQGMCPGSTLNSAGFYVP